jgi:hypothetical protein
MAAAEQELCQCMMDLTVIEAFRMRSAAMDFLWLQTG